LKEEDFIALFEADKNTLTNKELMELQEQ